MSDPANDMSLLDTPPADLTTRWLGRLEFRQRPGIKNLITAHPWGMRIGGVDHIVPAEMETDGMSISRLLWRFVDPPFYSLATPGVILHDAGYGGLLRSIDCNGNLVTLTRPEVDELLYAGAYWNGYSGWKCEVIFRAVKIGGESAWRNSHARNADVDLGKLNYDWTRET